MARLDLLTPTLFMNNNAGMYRKQIIHMRPGETGNNRQFSPQNSKEKGAPINLHPFWVCPRDLLFHNMYLASQMSLVSETPLQANALGNAGIAIMASQFDIGGVNGTVAWVGLNMGAWLLWLAVPQLRTMLTAPELKDGLLL